MPNVSLEHEAPLDVLREHPEAVLDLLRLAEAARTEAAEPSVEVLDTELSESTPSVRRADFVTLLRNRMGVAQEAVVVEIQRDRDDEKTFAWPHYAAYLHARYRVPVTLLVVAFDASVASWARTQRNLGSIRVFAPLVIGPGDLPEIASIEEAAAHPELSMLTALARLAARDPARREEHAAEVVRVFEGVMRSGGSNRELYSFLRSSRDPQELPPSLRLRASNRCDRGQTANVRGRFPALHQAHYSEEPKPRYGHFLPFGSPCFR